MFAPYAVAAFAILFSAASGRLWIYTVEHFDPPEVTRDEHVTV